MPGSTVRTKISKGPRGTTAPVSERQQLALLMQMTSDDHQGPGPGGSATPETSAGASSTAASGGGGGGGASGSAGTSSSGGHASPHPHGHGPPANPSPSRSKARNERGETPLHLAAIRGDLDQVQRLLDAGADPNQPDYAGWTPLHEASNHGWLRIARALLDAGANVNAKGLDNDTPLHDAVVNTHVKLVRLLMSRGADPNLTNLRGKTPVDLAGPDVILLLTDPLPPEEESDPEEASPESGVGSAGSLAGNKRLPKTPTRRNSAASARGTSSCDMRRIPPQNKAVEKPASPRVTLRLHQIKSRDDRKASSKPSERDNFSNNRSQLSASMEGKGTGAAEDVYEFKSSKEATPVRGASVSPELPSKLEAATPASESKDVKPETTDAKDAAQHQPTKRGASEMTEGEEGDEESRRKKRKDNEPPAKDNSRNTTPSRTATVRNGNATAEKNKATPSAKVATTPAGKPSTTAAATTTTTTTSTPAEKAPEIKSGTTSGSNSPKPVPSSSVSTATSAASKSPELESNEDSQSKTGQDAGANAIGPKVPPLKIVIPQPSVSMEPEQGNRNGKNGASRHHAALPYVVASSNSNDSVPGSGPTSPSDSVDKRENSASADDQPSSLHHQRVLRSSHRSGSSGPNPSGSRSSSPTASGSAAGEEASTSPQQSRQQSPTPSESTTPPNPPPETPASSPGKSTIPAPAPGQPPNPPPEEKLAQSEGSSSCSTPPTSAPTPPSQPAPLELHPRKRKLKPHREAIPATNNTSVNNENAETTASTTQVHPHEQPITNCYQLFLNIRKQIERRRKGLFPVQPKPPQGFKDYLMNRCTYVLASNAATRISSPNSPPSTLNGGLRELFIDQEKDRQKLKMQHVIEKEKLVLSVEQEILRVHGRAARALANQTRPFSACTILKDEEIYNVITPEQEEQDRNARSRYNGRLFLSWLQDVDDKWEKIKEAMLLRHHNEAESLHAVQRMDWEGRMKEAGAGEDIPSVPMVHVSDDFDLLPA